MTFTSRRVSEERPSRSLPWKKWALAAWAALRYMWRSKKHQDEVKEERAAQEEAEEKRVNVLKRVLVILCGLLLAVALVAFALRALANMQILSVKNIVFSVAAELPKDQYGHTNILLLGTGDKDHDGIDLTDSMMIASLDSKTQSVVMLSIPRDLWVTKGKRTSNGRINTIYRDLKGAVAEELGIKRDEASHQALLETAEEIGGLFGLEIHGVVKANFSGFVQLVDEIGGVEVDVPYDIVDTTYPGPQPDTYQTFRVSKGKHLFDGETALKYARSRHTTSDFGRSARQQQLLRALKEKIEREGLLRSPGTILSMISILGENVETTFSNRELVALAEQGMDVQQGNMLSIQLHATSGMAGGFLYPPPREEFGGASVLLPTGGSQGWPRIQTFTHLTMDVRWPYLLHPDIHIVNSGAAPGSAGKLGEELTLFGLGVSDVSNAPGGRDAPSEAQSFITSTADEELTVFVAQLLGMPIHTLPEDPARAGTGALALGNVDRNVITVTLGEDYTFAPVTTLLQPATDDPT